MSIWVGSAVQAVDAASARISLEKKVEFTTCQFNYLVYMHMSFSGLNLDTSDCESENGHNKLDVHT